MATAGKTIGARSKVGGGDRDRALLAAKLSKVTEELTRAKNEASHYRAERDAAQADAKQIRTQMAKQQWLVAGLEQARDGQLEDAAASEAVIVKLAAELQAVRQEVKQERKVSAVASSKEAAAQRMLKALHQEFEALMRRLQQQQEKVAASEREVDEVRRKLSSVEPSMQEQQKDLIDKDSTISKLTRELAEVRAASAELKARGRGQQEAVERLERDRRTCESNLKTTEKNNGLLNKEIEKVHERGGQLARLLVRRNDQVQVLQERNCLLHHLQLRGNREYACRTKDIYFLSVELDNLREQLSHMMRQAELNRALKVELTRMQRQLVASYHKRTVLETQLMVSRTSRQGPVGVTTDDTPAVCQAQALQRQLLKAAQEQARSKLQLQQMRQKVATVERGSTKNRNNSATFNRGYYLNQLRAAHAHIQAAQGVANWAIRAREEVHMDNLRLRGKVLQKTDTGSGSESNK